MHTHAQSPLEPVSTFRHGPRRALTLAAAAAGCLLLAACGPKTPSGAQPAPEVAVAVVAAQPLTLTTELPGRTAAFRVAEVRPQVNGLVQQRLFTEGGEVAAGQPLYQIDPAPFRAAFASAQAALARAEANLPTVRARAERYAALVADKAVSQQTHDDAAAALQQAEADVAYQRAALENARINLGYTTIVSPISGHIGRSTVTDGAIVTAYQPVALATIQQLDPIYVDVPQSTAEVLRLERRLADGRLAGAAADRSEVRLVQEDGTPYPLAGTLQFRDTEVDRTTGSVTLRLLFPNPSGTLLPGMFVRTVIQEGVQPAAILVPQQSVSRDPRGNPYVLLVDQAGTVQRRPVVVDRAVGNQWLVASGLQPGDRLVVEGFQRIRPGMTVRVAPAGANSPSAVPATPAAH